MTLDTITSKSKTLTHNQIYTKEEEVEDDEFFWHSSEWRSGRRCKNGRENRGKNGRENGVVSFFLASWISSFHFTFSHFTFLSFSTDGERTTFPVWWEYQRNSLPTLPNSLHTSSFTRPWSFIPFYSGTYVHAFCPWLWMCVWICNETSLPHQR